MNTNYTQYKENLENFIKEVNTEDLVEAYSHLKVPQRKKLLAVVTSLIDDATSYSATKRKVRVKRPISFEKIVSKLKYKQTDVDFKVSSIDPAIIPQSQILLVFNTKYRFLFIYQAKEGEQLSVKGTTLLNFDEDKSFKKRIRKPELILGKIQQTTKLRAVKMFGEAKSKPGPATGRINSDCILLRAIDKL